MKFLFVYWMFVLAIVGTLIYHHVSYPDSSKKHETEKELNQAYYENGCLQGIKYLEEREKVSQLTDEELDGLFDFCHNSFDKVQK